MALHRLDLRRRRLTEIEERYDLCVIGGGSAGYAAADAARRHGRRVVVVTLPGDLGGACVRRGCMPAKSILASTEALGAVEKAGDVGVEANPVRVDLQAVVERKASLVEYFVRSRIAEFDGIPVRSGSARFVDGKSIEVGSMRIAARRFLIATGSRISLPDIPGLAGCGYFSSDHALDMTDIPQSLLVVGAGPVGCEFAQYFCRLGSRVILVQAEAEILRNEDPDLAAAVRTALIAEGVHVALHTTIEEIRRTADGLEVAIRSGGASRALAVEAVMVASGRVPNIASLRLDRAGVTVDDGVPVVDAFLRTSNPRVFAAGDVLGRRCLVHVAVWAGERAEHNAFAEEPLAAAFSDVESHAVYTQPQLAVAGLTESEARRSGMDLRVARHEFGDIGKALVSDEPEGFIKMLAGPDGAIVGVGIVGAEALELIGEATAIVARRMSPAEVAALPHLHPSMAEIYARAAEHFL